MKKYAHIFWDLDHTLWDFTAKSRATLAELYDQEELGSKGIPDTDAFIDAYEEVNLGLWSSYEKGQLKKEVLRVLRFHNTLIQFGISDNETAERMGRDYLELCPRKPLLIPGAFALLQDLAPHYSMHIITNGFEEVQHVKLACSGITEFFDVVVTSEQAGARKPDLRIFDHALHLAKANEQNSLMIGDNPEADMAGARNAGWDHAHYAAETAQCALSTFRLKHLDDLRQILL